MISIKTPPAFVIFVLSLFLGLLLISASRTEAFTISTTAIIMCSSADFEVIGTDIAFEEGGCDAVAPGEAATGTELCTPNVGDSCALCLAACLTVGYDEDFTVSGGQGKIIYTLTASPTTP